MFAAYYIHFVVGSELVGTGDSQTLWFYFPCGQIIQCETWTLLLLQYQIYCPRINL